MSRTQSKIAEFGPKNLEVQQQNQKFGSQTSSSVLFLCSKHFLDLQPLHFQACFFDTKWPADTPTDQRQPLWRGKSLSPASEDVKPGGPLCWLGGVSVNSGEALRLRSLEVSQAFFCDVFLRKMLDVCKNLTYTPRKLTWNRKLTALWKGKTSSKASIFGFSAVKFPGCSHVQGRFRRFWLQEYSQEGIMCTDHGFPWQKGNWWEIVILYGWRHLTSVQFDQIHGVFK